MKKVLKIIFCVAVIAAVLLGFAAKYDTLGVYPGMDMSELMKTAADDGLMGSAAFFFYRNSFGRTVVARAATESDYDFRVYENLYDRYGPVVVGVRTARPGIATHWDFLNTEKKMTSLYELVSKAGMPVEVSDTSGSYTSFHFETVDGCRYTVRVSGTLHPILKQIRTPDGRVYQEEELAVFQQKVEWFYIGLLGALTVLLVCLLTVPAAIRRRKTGEKAKPLDTRKLLKNVFCILVVLTTLLAFDAKYQTHGAYAGQEYDTVQMSITQAVLEEEIQGMGGVNVYRSGYGRIVMARSLTVYPLHHWTRKVYNSVGRIAMEVQTTSGGIATHLDFFNCQWSHQQFAELLRRAGMPEENPNGPGFSEFAFTTLDGYIYTVRAHFDGTARILGVFTPDGEYLCDESLDAFTLKIMIFYLALAAVLSGVLVCLLKIPKMIEKRRAKTE